MEEQYGYLILEIGWEYNDEYYHTGYNGDMYDAPEEMFMDETEALDELFKREIDKFRGNDIGLYFGEDGIDDYLKSNYSVEEFLSFYNKTFNKDLNAHELWEVVIPKSASDEQIKEIMNMITLRFHTLHKIKIK